MKNKIRTFIFLFLFIPFSSISSFAKSSLPIYTNENILLVPPNPPGVNRNQYYCLNDLVTLTASPSPGGVLNWYGTNATGGIRSATPPTVNTSVSGSRTIYYVSQTVAGEESTRDFIEINVDKQIGTFCDGAKTTANSVNFDFANVGQSSYSYSYSIAGGTPITGIWSGASNYTISGLSAGQSVDFSINIATGAPSCVVTPSGATCKTTCPLPLIKPNFPLITQVYCVGNAIPNLSNTSPTTGIVGTWSPSNVINNAASGTYTFTPDPILHPCTETQTLSVTVNPIVTPTFSGLPPPTVCQNSTGQVLPTSSTNTIPITGTWGPFASINTTILGLTTYTFIPNSGQCVSASPTTLNVTVNSSAIPTFNTIPAFCAGTLSPSFPLVSGGITGVWTPTAISNTATGNYQFIPNISLHPCAPTPPPLTVTVTPNVTPTFAVSDTQCEGTAIITLPNNSTNTPQIFGVWDDDTVDTSILGPITYNFTATTGSCVLSPITPKTITVYSNLMPTFSSIPNFCAGTPAPSFPLVSGGITGLWSPISISNTAGTKNYQFTPDKTLFPCAPIPPLLPVTVLPSPVPSFSPLVPTDVCEGSTFVLPTNSNETPPITGSWSTLTVAPITTIDTSIPGKDKYTFIPDLGQCATVSAPIEITVNPSNTLISVDTTVTDAFEDNQIITVVATAPGNYLYQLDSGPLQTSPIFENVSAGTHTITVSDANGCSTAITKSDILVIKHPKYFTPNGDGFNDTWKLSGLSSILITKIYIFDRYGKLLKEIAAGGTGWDGSYLGVPVPADDYWFTVDYLESFIPKKFKSHFSLKR